MTMEMKWVVFMIWFSVVSVNGQIRVVEPIKFLALGDSYTIGESVAPADRWPNQLVSVLQNRGLNVDQLDIIARTGWRTDDLQNAITRENPTSDYNLVSLLIGVNNQYQGANFEIYPVQFKELLATAIRLNGGDKRGVFVLSIPDYGYTPFGSGNQTYISAEIDEYNEANKRISEELGVAYINITPISREALEKPHYIASDGLHPSGNMYFQWVKEIIEQMQIDTSVEQLTERNSDLISVYPNPANSSINISSSFQIKTIRFYNAVGSAVYTNAYLASSIQVNVSDFSHGIYTYQVTLSNGSVVTGKFVKR